MLETPVDNPPPVTGSVLIPEYAKNYCDKWGNIQKPPENCIEENRGTDFIKIYIYKTDPGYYFGYQIKMNKLILQKQANILMKPYETVEKAQIAARADLVSTVGKHSNNKTKLLYSFDKICYNQPELF